jgi:Holliday junction DNA helicase RuvA
MIGKLVGSYAGTTPDGSAVIMVGGVGYSVHVPLEALGALQNRPESELFIHTAVREDAIDLYGFSTIDDLSFFKQLISVSGIGPKSALGILNVADAKSIKRSIASGDSTMLTKVFGIGKKSAERIVVELRDKLALESTARGETVGTSEDSEVLEALMALGYNAGEVRKVLREIPKEVTGVRERIAAALKYLGGKV